MPVCIRSFMCVVCVCVCVPVHACMCECACAVLISRVRGVVPAGRLRACNLFIRFSLFASQK